MVGKPEGWRNKRLDDPKRHSDASRGIASGRFSDVKKPKYSSQSKVNTDLSLKDKTAIVETLELAHEHAYSSGRSGANILNNFTKALDYAWLQEGREPLLTKNDKEYIILEMELAATHAYDPEDAEQVQTRDKWLIPFIRKIRKKWNIKTRESYAF
jgi:hypothetical protein